MLYLHEPRVELELEPESMLPHTGSSKDTYSYSSRSMTIIPLMISAKIEF